MSRVSRIGAQGLQAILGEEVRPAKLRQDEQTCRNVLFDPVARLGAPVGTRQDGVAARHPDGGKEESDRGHRRGQGRPRPGEETPQESRAGHRQERRDREHVVVVLARARPEEEEVQRGEDEETSLLAPESAEHDHHAEDAGEEPDRADERGERMAQVEEPARAQRLLAEVRRAASRCVWLTM